MTNHSEYIEINRNFYDSSGTAYESAGQNPAPGTDAPEFLASILLNSLPRSPHLSSVLEIGPGAGYVLKALCDSGAQCVGIELSPVMADLSSCRATRAKVLVGDALKLNIPEAAFDGIMANAVIHLFPYKDAKALIALCRKWLRRGGVLFLTTTTHETESEAYASKLDSGHQLVRFRREWTNDAVHSLVTEAGFQIIKQHHASQPTLNKSWVGLLCRR